MLKELFDENHDDESDDRVSIDVYMKIMLTCGWVVYECGLYAYSVHVHSCVLDAYIHVRT